MKISEALTYDDVLLVPKYSTIKSRNDIDTSVDFGKGIKLKIPLVSANMKTVTGPAMAICIADLGGLALLHRFTSIKQQVADYTYSAMGDVDRSLNIGISVGVTNYNDTKFLVKETGAKIVCVDVAHGHNELCIQTTRMLSEEFPEILLIVGNIVTAEASWDLVDAGADVVKVGVGPGSLCSTRIETGNGVPQLTALDNIRSSLKSKSGKIPKIIADGGIRSAGDIVKALCFSDAVMLGNLLASTYESPGELVELNGINHKLYAGSSTHKMKHVEGVSKFIPFKGFSAKLISELMQGVRSGMSYQGVKNLIELKDDPEFIKITNASLIESKPM